MVNGGRRGVEENTPVDRSKLQRHKITQMNIPHTHTHTHNNHRKPTIEMLSCCPTVNVRRHHRCCFYFLIFYFFFSIFFFLLCKQYTLEQYPLLYFISPFWILFFRCLSSQWLLFRWNLVLPLIFRRSSSSPINPWFLWVVSSAHRLKQKNMKKKNNN